MDIETLLAETKAKFNHNAAKAYLKEKYRNKLILAEQGGLWKADLHTINYLNSQNSDTLILIDTFDNPVKIDRKELLSKMIDTYNNVMNEWYEEWQKLEKKR